MGKAQRRGVTRIETEGCSRHVQNSPDNGDGNFDFWFLKTQSLQYGVTFSLLCIPTRAGTVILSIWAPCCVNRYCRCSGH